MEGVEIEEEREGGDCGVLLGVGLGRFGWDGVYEHNIWHYLLLYALRVQRVFGTDSHDSFFCISDLDLFGVASRYRNSVVILVSDTILKVPVLD